jgi:hypothetical protein
MPDLHPLHLAWEQQCMEHHAKAVAKGFHDESCEYGTKLSNGMLLLLCHCSKRKREREGFTTTPDADLEWPPPACPRCYHDLNFDGDSLCCDRCSLSWDTNGRASSCTFTDDYGDLLTEPASSRTHHRRLPVLRRSALRPVLERQGEAADRLEDQDDAGRVA